MLDHSAAKHKLSVKPLKKHASNIYRGVSPTPVDLSTSSVHDDDTAKIDKTQKTMYEMQSENAQNQMYVDEHV